MKRINLVKGLLLISILVTCVETQAAPVFEAVIGGPEIDRGVFVSPTRDGGYVVVGVEGKDR